jgi:hypothetical protein
MRGAAKKWKYAAKADRLLPRICCDPPGVREQRLVKKGLLVARLRLRPGENFLEARIAAQRIPFPPQTEVRESNVLGEIRRLRWTRSREESLY